MDRDKLLKLIDAGDSYGLMLASVRAWLERYHPEAEYADVVAHLRDGIPDVQVPVTPLLASPLLVPA